MSDKPSKTPTVINLIGMAITVGTVVFFGGGGWARLSAVQADLQEVRTYGSVSFNKHEKYDDERVDALKARVTRLESLLESLPALRTDLRRIEDKLDTMKRQ